MLDRVFDFLAGIAESFKFWLIVYEYEQAVLLRRGKFVRVLEPGLHWFWPIIDDTMSETVVSNTANLNVQSLITQDGKDVSLSAVITYRIDDIKAFLLDVEGKGNAVADIAYGTIAEYVASNTLDHIRDPKNWRKMATQIRHAGKEYGINVLRVNLSDLTRSKTLRLLGHSGQS